ncbi:CopD family protein [Kutzneria viridogrisea]
MAMGELLAQQAFAVPEARAWYVIARVLDYTATALFLGGSAFVTLLWPAGAGERRTRRLLTVGWVFGLLSTVAGIGLEGVWATQRPIIDAVDWQLLQQVLHLDFGRVWVAKALLWVLAGVVLADLLHRGEDAARSVAWRVGALAIGVGLLRTTGMTGHASDAAEAGITQIADLVHLAGMCLWVGGLAVLLIGVLPRRRAQELAVVVPRYSTLALISVLAVLAAGAVLAWQLVGSVDAVLHSGYGQILLTKLAILLVLLAAAQASKSWVKRRLDLAVVLRGDAATVRPFVYSVAAETVLVLIVLLAAAFLVTASPGR